MQVGIMMRTGTTLAAGVTHMTFWVYPWSLKGIERLAPIVEAAHMM